MQEKQGTWLWTKVGLSFAPRKCKTAWGERWVAGAKSRDRRKSEEVGGGREKGHREREGGRRSDGEYLIEERQRGKSWRLVGAE